MFICLSSSPFKTQIFILFYFFISNFYFIFSSLYLFLLLYCFCHTLINRCSHSPHFPFLSSTSYQRLWAISHVTTALGTISHRPHILPVHSLFAFPNEITPYFFLRLQDRIIAKFSTQIYLVGCFSLAYSLRRPSFQFIRTDLNVFFNGYHCSIPLASLSTSRLLLATWKKLVPRANSGG